MPRPKNTPMQESMKQYVKEALATYMNSRKISQTDLSVKTGIPKTTINGYVNGTSLPTPGNSEKLSRALGIDKGDIDPRFRDDVDASNLSKVEPMTIKIPVLGKIACGEPIYVAENFSGYQYESITDLPSGNLYYLETEGKSMEPTIPNGSKVLIREQPEVENGEIAAVLLNDETEATLKRVKKQGNTIILMPDNPSFEPYIIDKDHPARIIGKAIRFTQNL
ncbi:LexA family protein [Mesobacillus stamsii]|uniref:Repressor LexA n=1 Tax=Mesobacillus stamsii TaxID=225347 RepID=A0ABU0FW86_9BACI|nr:XRE family transcriptional regulator [Mesobacillus stamsii]MDQ0414186.1 repressor LexA [Mesobacillus stamsii]